MVVKLAGSSIRATEAPQADLRSLGGSPIPVRDPRPVSRWTPALVPGELDHRSTVNIRPLPLLAQGAAVLTVVAGSVGVAYLGKSVHLSVDGKTSAVQAFGTTVGDILAGKDIAVGAHDTVVPSAATKIKDGDTITVRYGRKLTVTIDGVQKEFWTTALTVDDALKDLNLRADGAVLSVSRSQALGRSGLTMSMTMPKAITLTVGGQARQLTSTAAKVSDLLASEKVAVTDKDRINPGLNTPLTAGLAVVVNKVETREETHTVSVDFSTTTTTDDSMTTDQSKVVTKGVAGEKSVTVRQVVVDGSVESETEVSSTVTRAPVAQVVAKGTKAPTYSAGNTSGGGINLANEAMWDRVAACESGNNWSINTGNGYYGGLQFSYSTWLGAGGCDFAPRADLATREQQITVANRLYATSGLSQWGCKG